MSSLTTSSGPLPGSSDPEVPVPTRQPSRWSPRSDRTVILPLVAVALGAILAVLARARPAYDASGWLVWAEQTLHGHLNLDAAPSWKPLAYLFTLPYGLSGHAAARWLWILTACAGGVAAPLLAGRLAWRLTPRRAGWWPAWFPGLAAAGFAAAAVATMTVAGKASPTSMGYLRQVLITSSDPFVLALWLAAVDRLVARRLGWALALLWLAALGRPEVWVFLGVLAVWVWFREPRLRAWAVLALLTQPLAWFLAPGLAARSFLSAGNLDLHQATALSHGKFVGVFERVRGLSGTAVQIEVALSVAAVALIRDRRGLGLVGLALTWTLVEVAFALHGWSAVPRYLIEVGGLLAVVGGLGLGHLLVWTGGRPRRTGGGVALLVLAGLLAALVPFGRHSVDGARTVIERQRANATELAGLIRVVDRAGGPHAVLRCGVPVIDVGWQASLALELGRNVGQIGFVVPRAPTRPFVGFARAGEGWRLSLGGSSAARPAGCGRLAGLRS